MEKSMIRMTNISKIYDNGIVANNNAFIEIFAGEIHALAGENGAGKSTLMKILYGLEKPTSGKIYLNDNEVMITSPLVANSLGIGMVHQHFMLVNELTVAENVFLGKEITKNLMIDYKKMTESVNELAEKFGMSIHPEEIVGNLSIVQKQKVEILKALARKAKILILDEPTAVLTPQETQEFFKQLELLKKQGYTIIIITHKLNEIKQICDRITIMRNGKFIGMYDVKEISEAEISKLMVGRDVIHEIKKTEIEPGAIVLAVNHLTKIVSGGKIVLNNISFSCKQGEIVCLCGVEGNGQRELIDIMTGFDQDYSGNILLNGINIAKKSIKQIRDMGESHIPEDRTLFGVDLSSSIADNLISTSLNDVSNGIFINKKRVEEVSQDGIHSYQIKCEDATQKVNMLSGGNMQKVVVARETKKIPSLLVANQPTRGVDVGAIEFIHKKIINLCHHQTAVLLVSSDLTEVFSLADRILVFYAGNIVANITNVKEITEEELGLYMLGLKRMDEVKYE
jgi:simple sugar transport system ATP-binding protein